MTYQQFLDGHILISQPLLSELPLIVSTLVLSILTPILVILIYLRLIQFINETGFTEKEFSN